MRHKKLKRKLNRKRSKKSYARKRAKRLGQAIFWIGDGDNRGSDKPISVKNGAFLGRQVGNYLHNKSGILIKKRKIIVKYAA